MLELSHRCPTLHHIIQHSFSFHVESKSDSKMLDFDQRQGLGQGVGGHVIGGAIYELEGSFFDDPMDRVVVHVNVLCA